MVNAKQFKNTSRSTIFFKDVCSRRHILLLFIDITTELEHIQATENKKDTNGCTAAK
jgi:hypothetical protein